MSDEGKNSGDIEAKESFKEEETKEDGQRGSRAAKPIDRSPPSEDYVGYLETIEAEKSHRAAGVIQGGIYHMS